MPPFKRRGKGDDAQDPEPSFPAARILSQQDILDRLEEEIVRAGRYSRALVVLCVVPQRPAGEALRPGETEFAAEAVSAHLRLSDRVGTLNDGMLIATLPETDIAVVRVIEQRVAADLAVRTAGGNRRNWRTGTSVFPEDGADPPALVQAAIDRAQR